MQMTKIPHDRAAENAQESLEELQVKVAFLEDTLSKLSDEFYLQQKQLNVLKSHFSLLQEKLQNQDDGATDIAEVLDERPPHY